MPYRHYIDTGVNQGQTGRIVSNRRKWILRLPVCLAHDVDRRPHEPSPSASAAAMHGLAAAFNGVNLMWLIVSS